MVRQGGYDLLSARLAPEDFLSAVYQCVTDNQIQLRIVKLLFLRYRGVHIL